MGTFVLMEEELPPSTPTRRRAFKKVHSEVKVPRLDADALSFVEAESGAETRQCTYALLRSDNDVGKALELLQLWSDDEVANQSHFGEKVDLIMQTSECPREIPC